MVTVGGREKIFGILAGQVHLVGVDEAEESLEDVRLDIDDIHTIERGFFHVVLEHGGEHGAPGRQDCLVRLKFFLSDHEGDITVAHGHEKLGEIGEEVSWLHSVFCVLQQNQLNSPVDDLTFICACL